MIRGAERFLGAAIIAGSLVGCNPPVVPTPTEKPFFNENSLIYTECRGIMPYAQVRKEQFAAASKGSKATPENQPASISLRPDDVRYVVNGFNEATCGGETLNVEKSKDIVVPCNKPNDRPLTVEQLIVELNMAGHVVKRYEKLRDSLAAFPCPKK